jgi:cell division control protein 7
MATIRPRNAKAPFEIHHDEVDGDESMDEQDQTMDESRGDMEEDNYQQSDDYSDSDESDVVVDASVQEDMKKFQETFKGIRDRFRLINRIGEGNLLLTNYLNIY